MAISVIPYDPPIKNKANTNTLGEDVLHALKYSVDDGISIYTASNQPGHHPNNNSWDAYVFFKRGNVGIILSLATSGIAWARVTDINNATDIYWAYPCPDNS